MKDYLNADPDATLTRAWTMSADSDPLFAFDTTNITLFVVIDRNIMISLADYST